LPFAEDLRIRRKNALPQTFADDYDIDRARAIVSINFAVKSFSVRRFVVAFGSDTSDFRVERCNAG
jgi:hypothetical protein